MHLTNFSPVLLFCTPWKHQKTFRFSDVFRGYRKATLACNGLRKYSEMFVIVISQRIWMIFFMYFTTFLILLSNRNQYVKYFVFGCFLLVGCFMFPWVGEGWNKVLCHVCFFSYLVKTCLWLPLICQLGRILTNILLTENGRKTQSR